MDEDAIFNLEEPDENEKDYDELCRCWINEKMAPEILPFATDVVGRVMERIRAQLESLEEILETENTTDYRSVLIQNELERVKFVVRVYLRCRIAKIDKFAQYIQSHPHVLALLSSSERQYLLRHQQIVHRFYVNSFLRDLPPKMTKLDDTVGNISMVVEPDVDRTVFCLVNSTVEESVRVAEDEYVNLDKGSILLLRYSAIAPFVQQGIVSLI
ncbi:GINS complex subunit Sld5 [Schizosaccharomyces japonicus yFS275]|uniref:DNA replication complex GINS protein SLD5 n=1 Tax=Schizosaccharomyces japonicus (strain yFS275 / FY16936) TaxID=402676 RepID=B6JYG2_SCHJY|nr:GINS complex subunit Sld5 [Schizosaccharomyces japonicus yFS275]EEB06580.1 GINS complex subunit Sld5 [Schizosaccharomyces japonicus yFS275]